MTIPNVHREGENMDGQQALDHNSLATQKHLEINQGVITRMAENSRSCKVWCVTLVAAVLVLVARTGQPQHALLALGPTALFFVLDAYYLSLERGFRRSYSTFILKLREERITSSDLFVVAPTGSIPRGTLWAMFSSFSVSPFYVAVVGTVLLAWLLIL